MLLADDATMSGGSLEAKWDGRQLINCIPSEYYDQERLSLRGYNQLGKEERPQEWTKKSTSATVSRLPP